MCAIAILKSSLTSGKQLSICESYSEFIRNLLSGTGKIISLILSFQVFYSIVLSEK